MSEKEIKLNKSLCSKSSLRQNADKLSNKMTADEKLIAINSSQSNNNKDVKHEAKEDKKHRRKGQPKKRNGPSNEHFFNARKLMCSKNAEGSSLKKPSYNSSLKSNVATSSNLNVSTPNNSLKSLSNLSTSTPFSKSSSEVLIEELKFLNERLVFFFILNYL